MEEALKNNHAEEKLCLVVKELIEEGLTQKQIYEIFESFRTHLREAGRETDEDIVMNVMDYYTLVQPHNRLFPGI